MSEDLYEDRDCYIVHEDEKLYEGGEVQNNGSLIRPALRQGDHSSAGTPVRKTFDRTRSIRQWGCKDRHSKVLTSRGVLRDRRIRLSVSTAIRFYDVQDRLGFDQPSRAVEWLLDKAQWALMIDPSHVGLPYSCIHPLISSPSRHIDEGRRSPHLSLIKGSHPVSDQSRNVKSRSANSDTYFDPTLLYDAIRAPTCSIKEALGALNKPMDSDPLIIADGSVLHDDPVAAPLEQGDREFLYHNKPLQIVRDAPTILSLNVISAGSVHSRGAAFHFGYQHNISGAETRSCSCSCSSIQSVNVLGPAVHGRVQKPANGDHLGKRMAHSVMQTGSEDTIMSQLIGGSSGDLESPVVMINEAAAYLCSTPPFLHSFTQPAAGAYINEDSACDEALQELV